MRKVIVFGLLVVVLLSACRGTPSGDSPLATAAPTLPPTPALDTPEATAAAFLAAWPTRDYATMYSLLSPATRATVTAEGFARRCQGNLDAATVLTVTADLLAVLQQGDRAQATYRLIWDTALVGRLVTETVMSLSLQGDRWAVEGSGDLIWPGLGEANYLFMEYSIPARANIYDHNGLALASEGTIVTVGVVPGRIQDEQTVLAVLSQVTGLSPDQVRRRYAGRPAEWWAAVADIPAEVAVANAALLANTPGIEAHNKEGRTYAGGMVAPHLVGWVAPIPAEELADYRAQGYRGDESVGVAGLEQWGEPYLAGQHGGTLYLMSPTGQTLAALARRDPVPGRAIYTTFNREFQRQVQEILGDRRGAIVVLDVHTGAVLALASGPAFDPNIFIGPVGETQRNAVLADSRHPLFNRAVQGTYPCGSVFKVVTISAALEAGGMTAQTHFWCPGYWEGLGPSYRMTCWRAAGHGDISLENALTASCDVTFYAVGQALDSIDPNILPNFARAFGLGAPTGLAELREAAGLVPDPAWKQLAVGENWWVGDSVNLAIGQGYLLVTPLQIARMMAAVANGGTLYRPYVVERIASAGEAYPEVITQPEAVGTLPVSAEHLEVVRRALAGVTTASNGTATYRFIGMSIPVAGKTGTAQAPGATSLPHSWFAGYAPANDPEIAFVVMVENAGEGSSVAAPMARQVVEAYYGLALTPLPPEVLGTPTPTPEVSP